MMSAQQEGSQRTNTQTDKRTERETDVKRQAKSEKLIMREERATRAREQKNKGMKMTDLKHD